MSILEVLQQWQGVAVVVVAVCATVALLISGYQLRQTRKFQKETVAMTNYLEYLKYSVRYPFFGDGDIAELNGEERSRYEWFVSLFLLAAESILEYTKDETQWINAIREEILRHREYLNSEYFRNTESRFYTSRLQATISEALGG